MLVTNFDVESARVVRRRCVAADDDDGGDARRAVEVSWSQPYGTCVAREMANGADGSIATMVMMGFGAIASEVVVCVACALEMMD